MPFIYRNFANDIQALEQHPVGPDMSKLSEGQGYLNKMQVIYDQVHFCPVSESWFDHQKLTDEIAKKQDVGQVYAGVAGIANLDFLAANSWRELWIMSIMRCRNTQSRAIRKILKTI